MAIERGTTGKDILVGTSANDELFGLGDDDILRGLAGADKLDGGFGSDAASYSTATSGVTASLLAGVTNTGEAAGDTYKSVEWLTGSAFDDVLVGDAKANRLEGLDGTDVLAGGGAADRLDGGGGLDFASYFLSAVGVKVSLSNPSANTGEAAGDTFFGIEGLIGSKLKDTLTGDAADNVLIGGAGADNLDGLGGFDIASYATATAAVRVSLVPTAANTGEADGDKFQSIEGLEGSRHNDTLTGDMGDNTLIGGDGKDKLDGGAGHDTASYATATGAVTASLLSSTKNKGVAALGDTYISIENLLGSRFDDVLEGDAFNNVLTGGLGKDKLIGGAGLDFASYSLAETAVTVSLANPLANKGDEAVGDTYVDIEAVHGSKFADTLTGNALDNVLAGGAGADKLSGGSGFDFASYATALGGVTASLANAAANMGEAQGDTYGSIEGLIGSHFGDVLAIRPIKR
jgi:Ca2+-binding RTX toxin-like protein